ncbi:MAG: glycosyltransferase [Candidatus Methylomirabilia bacterium]
MTDDKARGQANKPADGAAAVVFCMSIRGHFNRLLPLIAGLAGAGVPTHVYTDRGFAAEVERAGGRFCDLFAGRPLERADPASVPLPCRFVSFAGRYAGQIASEIVALRPGVVIHDSFAVVGIAVANRTGLPRVNVCAGHNSTLSPPARARLLPRVSVSAACRRAVRVLRERFGMAEASPFSYYSALSPDLNVYGEPPEFLRAEEREKYAPVAFFGSLAADVPRGKTGRSPFFSAGSARHLRIYVSFGTVVWRYYEAEALAALEAIATAVSAMDGASAVVSLGGRTSTRRTAGLARHNVRVEEYVDQRQVLGRASVFITHHGLNSTHEAIYHRVPMISCPFFSDQPGLARRCQELGLAVPLVGSLRGRVRPADVRAALECVTAGRRQMLASLAQARRWELKTIRARGVVVDRIVDLMRQARTTTGAS